MFETSNLSELAHRAARLDSTLLIYSTRVFYPPIRPYDVEVQAAGELMVCTQYLLAIEAAMSVENEKSNILW